MSDCMLCQEDYCTLRKIYPKMEKCQFEAESSGLGMGLCIATDEDLVDFELEM